MERHITALIFTVLVCLALMGCSYFSSDPFGTESTGYATPCEQFNANHAVPFPPDIDLPPPVLAVHGEEVTKVVQEVAVDFHHKIYLELQDARTYFNEYGIHTIQLQFYSQAILDACGARKLIVDLTEELMRRFNDDPILVPEFINHALYPYNLEIYITLGNFFVRYVDPMYIRWICMEDGDIHYYASDLTDNDKNCWHVRRESFYTSRDIVNYQRRAESEYEKAHAYNPYKVFGDKIYIPPIEETEEKQKSEYTNDYMSK